MNIVFLSPYFPDHYKRFAMELKIAGANVLGIGDKNYDDLDADLKDHLTEYFKIDDLHNYDSLLRAVGFYTHKYGKIDRLESLNEYWLETEAKLRTDFNIYGIKNDTINRIRKKSEMKNFFHTAGVKIARGEIIRDLKSARQFIKQTGFPVVAKPDSGVGAHATYKIRDENELKRFFKNPPAVDYIFEEFVQGTIYSFDGLTDRNGKIVFSTSHVYSQGIMETVNNDDHVYYYSLKQIPKKLQTYGKAVVNAFELRERFFHIEFFKTADGDFTALEVNMRPPGGFTTDMFNFAFDFDIYKIWAELLVKNIIPEIKGRKYHCAYFSRKHQIDYINPHDTILDKFQNELCHHAAIAGVFRNALGDYGYILRTSQLNNIKEYAKIIHDRT